MSIKKDVAGIEDLALGTGYRTQLRNGTEVRITELNASNLPYNSTQSTKEIIDNNRNTISAHLNDNSNPHNITPNLIGAAPAIHDHDDLYYDKTEYINTSSGGADAGKPVILGSDGQLDPSIVGTGMYFVETYTPMAGAEYPDPAGEDAGAYWEVVGVDDIAGYEFTGGDLVGVTVYNGSSIILGTSGLLQVQQVAGIGLSFSFVGPPVRNVFLTSSIA